MCFFSLTGSLTPKEFLVRMSPQFEYYTPEMARDGQDPEEALDEVERQVGEREEDHIVDRDWISDDQLWGDLPMPIAESKIFIVNQYDQYLLFK